MQSCKPHSVFGIQSSVDSGHVRSFTILAQQRLTGAEIGRFSPSCFPAFLIVLIPPSLRPACESLHAESAAKGRAGTLCTPRGRRPSEWSPYPQLLQIFPCFPVFLIVSFSPSSGVDTPLPGFLIIGFFQNIGCLQLTTILICYMALPYMLSPVPDRELKKGSAELMILALLEDRPRHGYEIGQLIELRSRGAIRFNIASLYPLLYRLEKRNWIRGRWIEKAGQRRRRYYRLTATGKNVLSKQRAGWREFVEAINLITGIQHA